MQCPDPVTLELAQGTTCYTYTLPNPSYTNQAGNPTLGYFVTNAGATGQQFFTNVPFSGIIAYKAVDGSGQTADCNFQLTLTTMACREHVDLYNLSLKLKGHVALDRGELVYETHMVRKMF